MADQSGRMRGERAGPRKDPLAVTPKPPARVDLNPLKDFDLTEGQAFGIPSARLGFPSARFGFPSDWLGFPSTQLGIPSVRLGTAAIARIAFGPGRRRPAWELHWRRIAAVTN
jgi:hypothetical protein